MLNFLKKFIPTPLFRFLQPHYHFLLSFLGAVRYLFPSKNLIIIGVTGTKGKSTTVEIVNAILEEAGYTTALSNTIRFKIGNKSWSNKFKMTMPGRFFIQKFFRRAIVAGCTHVVLEMTSEGVKQFRHKFIELDALIFTNIAAEHIESHGSYEKYVGAKLQLAKALEKSPKENKRVISNIDDKHGKEFLDIRVKNKYAYSLNDARPHTITEQGITLTVQDETFQSPLIGIFNAYNILAAIVFSKSIGIDTKAIQRTLKKMTYIPGRVEKIDMGQNFTVIVDYAHTKESLEQLYNTFGKKRKICVLGNTGGGRDVWKRPEMARIADQHCSRVILTNEDPYDEDPRKIIEDMEKVIHKHTPMVIMDRRKAIRKALEKALENDVVLITGKGTDPYIMGPNNTKQPWSDVAVTKEELQNLLGVRKEKQI